MMPQVDPIRTWLEPGYDHGRFGAWMLDLPGCFVWGSRREIALARVPSAVGAYADWLERHGEPVRVPETDQVAVVEEVAAHAHDGYETNATFTPDEGALAAADVEALLRRLAFARDDLLVALEGMRSFEASGGVLAVSTESSPDEAAVTIRRERSARALVRHVAGSEVWLAGRLDSETRYEGPALDGEPDEFLPASRAWTVDLIRRLESDDPAIVTTDRHGERWTLAKVLRRLVYHSLDHLGELDRRLARASAAADRLVIRRDLLIDPVGLEPLLRAVGWYRLIREPGRLARLIEGSTQIVSAWEGETLVGFARAMTDDAAYGLITTVAVHPRWQGKGVGRRMLLALLENNEAIRFSLSSAPGAEGLYAAVGFVPDERAMVRRRKW